MGSCLEGRRSFWKKCWSTSVKVLQYSRGSTRVLSGQYSSTAIGVLEYSYWSIRVFLGEYSSTPTEVLGGRAGSGGGVKGEC